ncbi:unnamed protein product [Bathycoccus prasinos]
MSHIEGIYNHVDSITRRARRLSCYRMISPRMRFPDQWLDYVEENIDTWRKEWVEWFCDKPANAETCKEYEEKMKEREEVVANGDDMEKEAMPPLEPMPVSEDLPSLLEISSSNPDFTLLNAAISTQPDIVELIQGDGPFTIFAPVNSAFESWLEENNLSAEEALASPTLPDILKRHVLGTRLLAKDALAAVADGPIELDTLGAKVVAEKKFDDLYIGGAKVIATDVMASNGVVHVVDGVVEGV